MSIVMTHSIIWACLDQHMPDQYKARRNEEQRIADQRMLQHNEHNQLDAM